jgi:hypothetical protein
MVLDRPFKGSFDAAELFPGRRVAQPWASLERTFGAIGWSFALPCSPYILTATFRLPTSHLPLSAPTHAKYAWSLSNVDIQHLTLLTVYSHE